MAETDGRGISGRGADGPGADGRGISGRGADGGGADGGGVYGREVQRLLAGIGDDVLAEGLLRIEVHSYDDADAFVRSKCSVDEDERTVHVHELVTERAADGTPTQVRVKTKTGEALRRHFPGPTPVAAERDVTGADVITSWLRRAVGTDGDTTAAGDVADRATVEPDSLAAAGQDWVPPTVTAWRDGDDVVHLQARSMFVASTHPLPAGFVPPPGVLGVHYVTLPTPELVAAVVAGEADVPRLDTDPGASYRR